MQDGVPLFFGDPYLCSCTFLVVSLQLTHLSQHVDYQIHQVRSADEIFVAAEMSLWEKEKQHLAVLKMKCEQLAVIEEKGKLVIATKRTDCDGWLVHELEAVLA